MKIYMYGLGHKVKMATMPIMASDLWLTLTFLQQGQTKENASSYFAL